MTFYIDRKPIKDYIKKRKLKMSEIDLTNLEFQIEKLIQSRNHLTTENRSLREKLTKIMQERAELLNKKDMVYQKLDIALRKIREKIS